MTSTEARNRSSSESLDVHLFGLVARAGRDLASAMASAISEWRAARSLLRMDNAALKDIGVSRGNIEWVVRNGRAMKGARRTG